MTSSMKLAPFLLAALLGAGLPASANETEIPAPAVESFAKALQDALQKRDVDRVAGMVKYPLAVISEGRRRRIGRAQFAAEFDRVFAERVIREVLAQDPTQLFQNKQGVAFGNGVVWANEFCNGRRRPDCVLLVITINQPPP